MHTHDPRCYKGTHENGAPIQVEEDKVLWHRIRKPNETNTLGLPETLKIGSQNTHTQEKNVRQQIMRVPCHSGQTRWNTQRGSLILTGTRSRQSTANTRLRKKSVNSSSLRFSFFWPSVDALLLTPPLLTEGSIGTRCNGNDFAKTTEKKKKKKPQVFGCKRQ